MSDGQSVGRSVVAMYLELLVTVHSLQEGESLQGNFGGSRHELEELGTVLLVKGAQGTPEPLHL